MDATIDLIAKAPVAASRQAPEAAVRDALEDQINDQIATKTTGAYGDCIDFLSQAKAICTILSDLYCGNYEKAERPDFETQNELWTLAHRLLTKALFPFLDEDRVSPASVRICEASAVLNAIDKMALSDRGILVRDDDLYNLFRAAEQATHEALVGLGVLHARVAR